MSCDYAFNAGRLKAIRQFSTVLDDLLAESLNETKTVLSDKNEYWREIGKQDILLRLFEILSQ